MDWSGIAGSIGGAIVGGLFGKSSAADQLAHQKELMELQHKYNVDDYKHRYQWAVGDMRDAGLNPILAATNGIGGSINGVSAGAAAMAPTPDFAGAFNSAYQTASQREIAKVQADVAREGLELEERRINNAKEKQDNDIKIDNARFALEKMVQEAAVRRADELNSATIQNMKDRLEAEKEHWYRADMNGAQMASAAMAHANAVGLQAAVAQELGISRQAVMEAQEAYIGLQSANAEEALKWQQWLNEHPSTRGAVGFLGALFDTVGLGARLVKPASAIFSANDGDNSVSYSNADYESWIR